MRFLIIILVLGVIPTIRVEAATTTGPGPIANVRVTPSGLIVTLRGTSSVFTGEPRVDVSDGGPWIACDRKATVQSGGSQLLQKGSVNGVFIAEYFPQDESRRIRIRNGDGGATELDLVRTGDGFLIAWTNRTPSKAKRLQLPTTETFDALANRSVTVRAAGSAEPAFDVVAVLTNAPLPPDANDQAVTVIATNVATGQGTPQNGTLAGDGRVSFHHILLPVGTYRFEAFRSISYGNPLTFLSSLSQRIALDGTLSVSKTTRTVMLTIPDVEVPPSVASTIVVDGVEALAPSVSNRVTVGMRLTQVDGPATVFADRDVTNANPIPFEVRVPAGTYSVQLSAGSLVDGASRTSTSVGLGTIVIADELHVQIPPLVRLTGSILDPDFRLFTDATFAGDVSQRVFVGTTAGSSTPYSALSSLFGFSRTYSSRVPAGGSVLVSASLAVDVGGGGTGNPFGRLDFQVTPAPVVVGGDVDIDFPVPALPNVVTLAGTALDRTGKTIGNGFVYVQGSDVDGLSGATFAATTSTDKNGAFTLRVLRGRAYRITVIDSFGIVF